LWNIILNQTLYLWWVHMTIYDCICISDWVWYQCLCRGLCRCLFRGLWNYLWPCSYYKVCTVYQKNTVINIAVTPLLSAWRPKNYQKIVVLYYLPTSYPTDLHGFLINMTNYLIKSIFKDKPSTVLKWAFSLCSAVSTCLHCDLWQKVNYISKFYQPSLLNETRTISKSIYLHKVYQRFIKQQI
jgi:hypothetical protein